MSLWLAASLFFGGAFSHIVVSRFLNLYQGLKFTMEVTNQIVAFLSMISMDLSMVLKMKYENLKSTDISEEEIQKIIQMDKRIYHSWKMSFARKMFPLYPRRFRNLLHTFDWDGALKPIDDIYYDEEYKTQEAQTNEQD